MINYKKIINKLKPSGNFVHSSLTWEKIESSLEGNKNSGIQLLEKSLHKHRYFYSSWLVAAVCFLFFFSLQAYKETQLEKYINQYSLVMTNYSIYQNKYNILSNK